MTRLPSEKPLGPNAEAALPVRDGEGDDVVPEGEGLEALESSEPSVTRDDSSGSESKEAETEEALLQPLIP